MSTTNKRLKRIDPLKAGAVLGVLYALLSFIMVPFFMLAGAMAATAQGAPFAALFGVGAIFLPIIYGVMGYLSGLLIAVAYNLAARWTGGIEFTFEDVP